MPFDAARQTATVLIAAMVLSVTGCAQATAPRATASHASTGVTTGDTPSESAKMICKQEAEEEIAAALGVRPSRPPTPTWADRLYSCQYTYPTGAMVLSVKELPDDATASAYYFTAQKRVPGTTAITLLGQNGFAEPDGSVSVRKDFKILRIDVSALPKTFGKPAHTRANVAYAVAAVILGCWTGS
jgi:Flp pilus assembly protein TadD